MTGSKYVVDVSQLEDHGEIHQDAHMLFMTNILDEQPNVIAVIMTQTTITQVRIKIVGN